MDEIVRRLYAVERVRELDRRAIAGGIPGAVLMQRAAQACWHEIEARWPQATRVDVFCGTGNNGGDGYEIARLARRAGRTVRVWQLGGAPTTGDALAACRAWLDEGGQAADAAQADPSPASVIVDALYGIGLSRALTGAALAAVRTINAARVRGAAVLAVDVPSGLDAQSGAVLGGAVEADVTVTFIGNKPGLWTGAGRDQAGAVVLADLAVPAQMHHDVQPVAQLMDARELPVALPKRAPNSHKGRHGHVLLIGGNHGTPGAILLAARAALRAGAGLVSVATRAGHAAMLSMAQPEIMSLGVEHAAQLAPLIERASVIAVGPGLGQDEWAQMMLGAVLQSKQPQVWDADALNLLAHDPVRSERWVLTPHPGEAGRLLGWTTADIQQDRLQAARQLQARYGGVAVLKGAGTVVQGGDAWICPYGNPGMAVGGMGDALTGVIAALLAQGLSLETAARIGVLAHARAGDVAARAGGERGLLPSDLIEQLRVVLNP